MLGSRSSMARKFGQSRRHWPMSNGVWPKLRIVGSSWRRSVRWLSQHCSAARTDIEIDALDGLVGTDRVLAALQDVMNGLWLERTLPALVLATRFAPACHRVGLAGVAGWARFGLAPFHDLFVGELWPHARVDDRVHRAGVVDLVARDRRCVGRARTRVREHLHFERRCRACPTSGSPRRACTGCRPLP